MKVFVQYTTNPATPYFQIDSRDWGTIPLVEKPTWPYTIQADSKWIFSVVIQGVKFQGYDGYAVQHDDTNGVVWFVGGLFDPTPNPYTGDPGTQPGQRSVDVWSFKPNVRYASAADVAAFTRWELQEGALMTEQNRIFYSEETNTNKVWKDVYGNIRGTMHSDSTTDKYSRSPWQQVLSLVRYGVWVDNALYDELKVVSPGVSVLDWIGDTF